MRSLVQVQDSPAVKNEFKISKQLWGYSSVGRALPLQGRRQRFESAYLQPRMNCGILTVKKNQSIKGVWWRPRDLEPMKGVTTDDMPRGAGRMH